MKNAEGTPLHRLLRWESGHRLPLVLQTEATECGLACLAMVAGFHGLKVDLPSLRRNFSVSLLGSTLGQLMQVAAAMALGTRPVKLQMEDLKDLRRPAILHWNFNHFVVLKAVRERSIVIHDPAQGLREVPMQEVSASFTGVALELWPIEGFEPATVQRKVSLRQLIGQVRGLVPAMAQVLLLALVLEVFVLAGPFYMQWVIDDVIVSADHGLLLTLGLAFGLLVLFQQAVSLLRAWVMLFLATNLNLQWRNNLFNHLVRLPVAFFESRHLGDVVSRFGAIDAIQRNLTSEFVEAILDGVMSLAVIALMFLYSPLMASVALAVIVLYGLVRWASWQALRRSAEEQIVHTAKQQSHFLETVRGIKPIKLFQRGQDRRQSWLALVAEEINAGLRNQRLQLLNRHFNGVAFGLERVVIVALGASMVIEGGFTVGALVAFLAYKDQFTQRAGQLIDRLFELRMVGLHMERLADIALSTPEEESPVLQPPRTQQAGVALVGVHFRYSEQSPWVLQDLNLTVAPGEALAIVGPSGSGKTTLIQLLLGLRPAGQGRVTIGDTVLTAHNHTQARGLIASVTQDDMLFAGSIADNIAFFDPDPRPADIEKAARLADVHTDIEALPMGYNTLVGDMGTALSGGQKQRVLLARALYREPAILVLDEATSHLDVESEERVNAAIRALPLTRILIAHRPQTIASADRAVVLCQGRIVAESKPVDFDTIRHAMRAAPLALAAA